MGQWRRAVLEKARLDRWGLRAYPHNGRGTRARNERDRERSVRGRVPGQYLVQLLVESLVFVPDRQ